MHNLFCVLSLYVLYLSLGLCFTVYGMCFTVFVLVFYSLWDVFYSLWDVFYSLCACVLQSMGWCPFSMPSLAPCCPCSAWPSRTTWSGSSLQVKTPESLCGFVAFIWSMRTCQLYIFTMDFLWTKWWIVFYIDRFTAKSNSFFCLNSI